MARYFLISIQQGATTVWLTSDGTNTGRRCRAICPEIATLFEPESGNTTVAAGGSPFTESPLSAEGGRPFEIQIPFCPTARFDELVSLKDAAGPAGEYTIEFDDGEPGSKTVTAIAFYNPVPIGFSPQFSPDYVRDVVLRFITTPV